MKDKNWIRQHISGLIDESITNAAKGFLILNKLQKFGGKLYKYYSFENEWSLKNLERDIIHFSKPQTFNDPFDCVLGFSINQALKVLLPTFFDKNLNFSKRDPRIKEIIQMLFGEQPTVDKSKEAKLLQLITNLPSVQEAIQMGSVSDGRLLQEKVLDELFNGSMAEDFFALIQGEDSAVDLTKIQTNEIYLNVVKPMLMQKKCIDLFPQEGTGEGNYTILKLINIFCENNIVEKIKKLAELCGQDGQKLEKEFLDIDIKLKTALQNVKEIINKSFAISCFSETPSNVLMWSHYGSKHTGFCVEYDFNICKDIDVLCGLVPVLYTNERPTISSDLFDLSDLDNIKLAQNNSKVTADLMLLLLTKSKVWEYENEWRIIGIQDRLKDGHYQILPIVSGIYMGANISDENKVKISRIAREKKVKLYKYKIDNDKYKLNLEQD